MAQKYISRSLFLLHVEFKVVNCVINNDFLKPSKEFLIQFCFWVDVVAKPFNDSILVGRFGAKRNRRTINVREDYIRFCSECQVFIPYLELKRHEGEKPHST